MARKKHHLSIEMAPYKTRNWGRNRTVFVAYLPLPQFTNGHAVPSPNPHVKMDSTGL